MTNSDSSSDNVILKVNNLVAGYQRVLPIVIDVSVEVVQGEILTLLGPNGAGKSTLIKGICGLVEVISGEVLFQGENISDLETHEIIARRVAYVPQTHNVFSKLTVAHNLDLGAISNFDAYQDRLSKVFDLFPDLKKFKDTSAGKLSGGQRQMLALGRALMANPILLLIDEPSAGLSPKLRDQVFQQVVQIRDSGVTVIMVEQNAHAALSVSDRGMILANGRLRLTANAVELLEDRKIAEIYFGARSTAEKS
ncbi:MAG: ABC transporter ATP-binding protein [Gammaproteobacteria bacterium]|jgi:ABC-type branched-subunit amino acid transport system ATPase component|nr:ABC transporter ATP-binding protein [Gammaproteobacteria bacterium]